MTSAALAFDDLADDDKHSVRTWRPPANSMMRVAPNHFAELSPAEVDRQWEELTLEEPVNLPPLRALPKIEPSTPPSARSSGHTFPRTHLRYDERGVSIVMELPGFELSDVTVEVQPEAIHLRGERKSGVPGDVRPVMSERADGRFRRSIKLLHRMDPSSARATMAAGVLVLELCRARHSRSIAVREL